MTRAPVVEASSMHDAALGRVPRGLARVLLGTLKRLALAALTLIVIAYFLSPGRGSASPLAIVFDAVTASGASAERDVSLSESHHCQDLDDAVQIVEMKVVESDGDDDKDPRCDVPGSGALSFRVVPVPPKPDRVLRGELPIDPSHIADGPGLPRGPPA